MPLSQHNARFVQELMLQRAAIVLEPSQDYLIEARLSATFCHDGSTILDDVIGEARASEEMQQQIVEALTTNETLFFRDQTPFCALRDAVIPRLMAGNPGRRLTIWSAACSTGQEPYSISMLIADRFPELERRVRIVGTDLSSAVIERARAARYRQLEVNRGLPATYLVRYFTQDGPTWLLHDRIRRMVEFSHTNLLAPWPVKAPLDIVFLRNVLIYIDRSARHQILDRVLSMMAPDGVLFLGVAETTVGIHDGWEPVTEGRASFFKPRHPVPMKGA